MKTFGPILGMPVEQGEIVLHWLNRILRFFAGVQNDNRDVKRVQLAHKKRGFPCTDAWKVLYYRACRCK